LNIAAKRRAAAIGLGLFALWPLLHHGLFIYADISPWRFFGWAMYCQPKLPLQVDVRVRRGDTVSPLGDSAIVSPQLRRQQLSYMRRREIWGSLLPPDDLASEALAAVPDATGVEIVVRRLVLDPSTAHITAREQRYQYQREPSEPARSPAGNAGET
jgi:hypothetical protein